MLVCKKSSILLRSFTYYTGRTWQSFKKSLHWRAEQEPLRLQKKCQPQKINIALHHVQVRHSAYTWWTCTLKATAGSSRCPSNKAWMYPRPSRDYPSAAPDFFLGFHMLLLKSGSVNHGSCIQSLLLSPECKVTQRNIPEAAGIKGKGRQHYRCQT